MLSEATPWRPPATQGVVSLVSQAQVARCAVDQTGSAAGDLRGEIWFANVRTRHRDEVGVTGREHGTHRLGAAHAATAITVVFTCSRSARAQGTK